MLHPDFPFKGKPTTNTYVQTLLGFIGYGAWLVTLFTWPVATLASSFGLLLFFMGRGLYRDILPEWRKHVVKVDDDR